jgi:hypothetical protein
MNTKQSKSLTIYDIKRLTSETSPYYFTSKTLKFFGQTMRSFSVKKQSDGRIKISAPMRNRFDGRIVGESVRFFNPANNQLELN